MRSLIESLKHYAGRHDATLTATTKNAKCILASLAEANVTMAALCLGSVDACLAVPCQLTKRRGDADLESLNEAVKLLEDLD